MADLRTTVIHPAQLSDALEAAFPAADAERGAALDLLAELRDAKAQVYARQVERLRRTLPEDDPRVQDAAARGASAARFAAAARMEATRSRRPAPPAEEGVWILWGYVWGAGHAPIAGATVALHVRADGRDQPVEATTSARDGSFLLRVAARPPTTEIERLAPALTELRRQPGADEPEEVRKLRAALLELDARDRAGALSVDERARFVASLERFAAVRGIALPAATVATTPTSGEPRRVLVNEAGGLTRLSSGLRVSAAVTAALYLRVTDAAGALLLADDTPLAARLGEVTYRDVEVA